MKRNVSVSMLLAVCPTAFAVTHYAAPVMAQETGEVARTPPALVRDYASIAIGKPPAGVDSFYVKCADAHGIKVMSSAKVPDAALLVARDIVIHMLAKRPDLRAALVKQRWRVGVMAESETTTDIPEHRHLKKPGPDDRRLTTGEKKNYERIEKMTDKEDRDRRARGLGGNPTTCAEENLLGYPGTRYFGENILVHEFSHAIMGGAIRRVDPGFHKAIRTAYREAMEKGLWQGHYAATNANEYWAEGTQTWFYSNYPYRDGTTQVQSPEDLAKYDPKLFELLGRVYPNHHIPMDVYHGKNLQPGRRRRGSRAARRDVSPILAQKSVEQTDHGTQPSPEVTASFDGLGVGFAGPQGTARLRNPSDNSLAVGPDHIVQTVNSQMAIFTKKGQKYSETGRVLYGPVATGNVFKGFGAGPMNNGDAVVRYDQLADRWLIVMPIFRRLPPLENEPEPPKSGDPVHVSRPRVANQPGPAAQLFQPPPLKVDAGSASPRGRRGARRPRRPRNPTGSYAMCYAVSTSPDPLGSYYRYMFVRPLFPDYPRPAVWPDGYYVPTSTSDNFIQKQMYVVDRAKMLAGEDATEQGIIIDDVNFLNSADLDGKQLPPDGAPNFVIAAGGSQLKNVVKDDGIYVWKFHVDWDDPAKTTFQGPKKIDVAPYEYLGGGQLTKTVPQPGTDRRLDSQGDKIMARVVYRRIGERESIVAVHSVNTAAGGGGVRWYEFRVNEQRDLELYQQGTYAPGGDYRWMASPAMDADGNIGIGYSFGGTTHFPGQRFAGRLRGDPLGVLTLREAILIEGEAAQTTTLRWEDYTQTAIDPSDDRTIWYVGDYLKKGAKSYSSRIGAFRLRRPR